MKLPRQDFTPVVGPIHYYARTFGAEIDDLATDGRGFRID
jgi:hypothetical protein